MKIFAFLLIAVLAFNLTGCAGLSDTQQRSVTGGLGGAAGGAVIGAIAGNAGMGALIGGAVGTAGGFLYGKHKESEQKAYEQGRKDAQR
ncbi:YMGG-like glycine zipper-containing protein [Methyloglobulus sp.]|uniref:YMGG-like glycine zipper-containing protein n=1 Tax=Methyloglobulus sp. TaxID=2518622 RepID=UPI003988B6DC